MSCTRYGRVRDVRQGHPGPRQLKGETTVGIIRKSLAVSTLGGVKYTSKREAQTKNASAQARLAKAETKALKGQAQADAAEQRQARVDATGTRWQPVVDAIEAGEASWDDLSRLQKMSMPIGYQMKCKAAMRRLSASQS